MAKFCAKCGKEINEEATICVSCGVPTGKNNIIEKKDTRNIFFVGFGIVWLIIAFLNVCRLKSDFGIDPSDDFGILLFTLLDLLIPFMYGILGSVFSVIERKTHKTNINLFTMILGFVEMTLVFVMLIMVVLHIT